MISTNTSFCEKDYLNYLENQALVHHSYDTLGRPAPLYSIARKFQSLQFSNCSIVELQTGADPEKKMRVSTVRDSRGDRTCSLGKFFDFNSESAIS